MADKILIAEGDLYQRMLLAGHLSEIDCETHVVVGAAEALDQVHEASADGAPFDLAIVDMRLTSRSGGKLYRDLARRYQVPVILLSDRGSVKEAMEAMHAGAYDYITKPFTSLDDLGLRVSRALERAQLIRENETHRRHLEKDLQLAKLVQEKLLPASLPFPGRVAYGTHYSTCDEIGGDLYDVFELSDNALGFCIFDVAGHGVSAALIATIIKFTMSAGCRRGPEQGEVPPLELLNLVNPQIKDFTTSSQFATLFYGLADLRTGELHFTSAGHCRPLLIPVEQSRAHYLEPRQGLPVGILADGMYHQEQITLEPGMKLLLYTDGVTEAQGNAREQFGEERLLEVVRGCTGAGPQETVDAIVESVYHFTGGRRSSDDITLLCVERIPPPAGG